MWIMLNNEPFDLSKMKGVSGVIEISTDYIKNCKGNYRDNFPYDNFTIEQQKEIKDCLINGENKIFGYCFKIDVIVYIQRYLNGSDNGITQGISKKFSSVYKTKEAAQTALEHFLFETNVILNNLPKINI
jgi:hypothetical protein